MMFEDNQLGAAPAVWSINDIAAYLQQSKGATRAMVNRRGFPQPITPGARSRRWFADEVLAFLREHRSTESTMSRTISSATASSPGVGIRPQNVSVRAGRQ